MEIPRPIRTLLSTISRELQYFSILTQAKPPPSSYKPVASRAGGTIGTAVGADGRPRSVKGVGFSNKLSQKANELETTKYKNELEKKGGNNPE